MFRLRCAQPALSEAEWAQHDKGANPSSTTQDRWAEQAPYGGFLTHAFFANDASPHQDNPELRKRSPDFPIAHPRNARPRRPEQSRRQGPHQQKRTGAVISCSQNATDPCLLGETTVRRSVLVSHRPNNVPDPFNSRTPLIPPGISYINLAKIPIIPGY